MNVTTQNLFDKSQTGKEMKRAVKKYAHDLTRIYTRTENDEKIFLSDLPLCCFHDIVRNIPYRQDQEPVEVVARPFFICKFADLGADCKKKGILIASWAELNGYPWRFVATSTRKDKKLHHVFPQIFDAGTWLNADATYQDMKLFENKTVTKSEVL